MSAATDDAGLQALLAQVERDRGLSLRSYKDKCLKRRLAVRMRAHGVHGYSDYAAILARRPEEYDLLVAALAINVTKFFRNPETYAVLREKVVAPLWAAGGQVRVWSAGCASGEEPYGIAMLFHDVAGHRTASVKARLRIDATDLDPGALEDLRRASYDKPSIEELPGPLLERHFSSGPPYRLDPDVAACVHARRHDLTRESPPDPPYDLILCRNVVIYFDRALQEKLFQEFADALRPGGYLLLGKVETLFGSVRERLTLVDARERLYRRPL